MASYARRPIGIVHVAALDQLPDPAKVKLRDLVDHQIATGDRSEIAPVDESPAMLPAHLLNREIVHVHGDIDFLSDIASNLPDAGFHLVGSRIAASKCSSRSRTALFPRARRALRRYRYLFVENELERDRFRKYGIGILNGDPFYSSEDVAQIRSVYQCAIGRDWRAITGIRAIVASKHAAIEMIDNAVHERAALTLSFLNTNLAYHSFKRHDLSAQLEKILLLNDGVGIDLASKLLYGKAFPDNLNGTDFVPAYLDQSTHSLRIYLLGARREVAERAFANFHARWPRHVFVGWTDGFFDPTHSADIAAKIKAAKPDIIIIAMGNPNQELWAAQNIPALAPVGVCVGALFDFMAGEVRRAPHWVRTIRMEWAFRMLLEPRRLARRYTLEVGRFFWEVCRQYFSGARA